jgi:hypothetical protein
MILNYPGGAGGQWLRKILLNYEIKQHSRNFHYTQPDNDYRDIETVATHSVDPSDFDCLYSGSYYFNFFVNVIYKAFLTQSQFRDANFATQFFKCVDTAVHLCKFEDIKHLIYFNFDDLLYCPHKFFDQVQLAKQQHQWAEINYNDFLLKRGFFFETCVDTQDLFENFDSTVWVAFVIGQLMNKDIVPTDFSIGDFTNLNLTKKFAELHYAKCDLVKIHHCETQVKMPEFFATAQ